LKFFAQFEVQGRKTLVHQQHGRLGDDRTGKRDALSLATGQGSRAAVAIARQLHHVERARDAG
jgi:hypothetical protein